MGMLLPLVAFGQLTQQDKIKQQTLNLPQDPPLVAVGETSRLTFQISPLSGQGLLSEQTRNALKAILKLNGGAPIIHIRAFSAGNGDVRRIPQIVADVLGEKHVPLPSVSVLQAGALTQGDAQVVLETISIGKKEVNKDGLTFHAAEMVAGAEPEAAVKPLFLKAVDQLAGKMNGHAALSVTCYVSNLENGAELLSVLRSRFADASVNVLQPRRLSWQAEAACEGVSRGGNGASHLAFTGTQIAFGAEEKDAALAIQRLTRGLREAGAGELSDASLIRVYILSEPVGPIAKKQITGKAPNTVIPVENVGASSAGMALDAVAPVH